MRTIAALAVACVATVTATEVTTFEVNSQYEQEFMMWAMRFGKSYQSVEEFTLRIGNYIKTHLEIEELNARPNKTVVLAHNKFSDWSDAEYKSMLNYVPHDNSNVVATVLDTTNLPDSVNWVEAGAVNAVQDQAVCGSCWAFSAIASMEGFHFNKTGELLKLSEQQCVDCDTESMGCGGGWQDNCMYYVQDNGGISLLADYPYIAQSQTCFADFNGPVSVNAVNHVVAKSEAQLLAALALGPVSVTVDADSTAFRNYSSGVVTGTDCGTSLDHAIVAVGYGTEDGEDYYLVRNSWGTGYGDKGYIKIGRGGEDSWGVCGIQEISVYADTN